MSSPRLPGRPGAHRPERRVPYWLSFGLTVVILGGVTMGFVLFVLPSRFVFQSGLPSSGVSFPVMGQPFQDREVVMVDPRPDPAPPPPVEEADPATAAVAAPPAEGPAEILWRQVTPLMAEGRVAEALPLFEAYLERFPEDHQLRMEYGIALARAGRPEWARETFMAVAQATGETRASVELARTLAGLGELEEAASVYRSVLVAAPERHDLRLELASVLWTAGEPAEAERILAQVPAGAPEEVEAREVRALLAAAMVEPEPEPAPAPEPALPTDLLERALVAVETGDHETVRALYREDRVAGRTDPDRILAWADLFQFRLEDPETALALLEERETRAQPTLELQLRTAQLLVWTGQEEAAERRVEAIVSADPDSPEAWALLGDLRRWRGVRMAAAEAYDRALALDPSEPQARAGREETRETARLEVRNRVNPGVGIELQARSDSDDFSLFQLGGRGALLTGAGWEISARSGYRRVEGIRPGEGIATEPGVFGELELSRWWREGTVRASVAAGAEEAGDFGTDPVFRAGIEARHLGAWSLTAGYRRERAYAFLSSLEAYDYAIQADQVALFVSGRPAQRWSTDFQVESSRFSGAPGTTWRLGGLAALYRDVAPGLRIGVSTRALTFTEGAPFTGDRRVFWDPELFWVQELPVELFLGRSEGWSARARLSPGIGLVQDRGDTDRYWSRQLGLEGGPRYHGSRGTFDASLFMTRGREGGYRAAGITLGVTFRP